MDITNFIEWFFDQVVTIFTKTFGILDNIKFAGTSLLNFILLIGILTVFLPVILTIGKNNSVTSSKSKRVRSKERSDNNEE